MSSSAGPSAAGFQSQNVLKPHLNFLAGGGEMGARMRAFDWSKTPLGPPALWPQSLKTIVRVMLDSRYAMWMLWGPELTFFWSGFPEETYHTFSYSPVYDDESRISGMLCVVTEVTERIIGERRLKILRDLASRAIGSASVEERCRGACQVLAQHPFSVPFAGVYLLDPSSRLARRVAHTRAMPSYEPLYVLGDFARLVQCVGNVLSNAVKYTEPGGQISIRTGVEDSTAFIEVSDTGMGIPGELLSSVFDLFVQSERTLDRAQGGLGIGLAVVKRLVEMHEGVVHARSDGAGRGSTFEIRLPRIARPEAAAQSATPFKAEPQRVLIVDDNADAANSLSMLLAFEGHQTQVAYDAAEALACIECFRPEVALLDIGLPEMDGYELAKRLRAIPQMNGLRIIALTGYGQAEDRQRVLHSGFDAHLVKPVELAALERALAGISAGADTEQA